ncbi:MAG: transcriptional regulator [Deltaproteobacteria bacterium]|nr:MAG: transcriptional regulator [Deltaproteobacteria bacterium]
MKIANPEIFRLHAEFCKVLANPKRLMIIALLSKREMSVGEVAQACDVPLTTISQHLRVLRERFVVNTRKEGQTVYCQLADERLMDACVRIRTVLLDNMRRRGTLAREIDPEGVSDGD